MDEVTACSLAANYQTPLYVYDLDVVRERARSLREAIRWPQTQLLYAIKANPCPGIAKTLFHEGFGCDCVAPGEIALARACGLSPEKILFTENNMSDTEQTEVMAQGVMICAGSLARLQSLADAGAEEVAVRFNPDIGASEHAHTLTAGPLTKFGVHHSEVDAVRDIEIQSKTKVVGCHMHIGSGSLDATAFVEAMEVILSVAKQLPHLKFIDFGGGLGVPYRPNESALDIPALGSHLTSLMEKFCDEYGRELEMRLELGRFFTAEAGHLLTTVTACKTTPEGRTFVGCDSGFNHLIRPMMYGSYHHIRNCSHPEAPVKVVDVVGNICESGDIFARDRQLPQPEVGDILSIDTAGAYGMAMASNYNIRPLPAEITIQHNDQGKLAVTVERPRQSVNDILASWPSITPT